MSIHILCLDVSLCNTGVAVVDARTNNAVYTGCIRTENRHKKDRVYKTDDTARRIREILVELDIVYDMYEPSILVAELPVGGGQSAAAVEAMAISKAVVVAFSWARALPLLNVPPDHIKKALTGKRAASKDEIQDVILQRWPGLQKEYHSKQSRNKHKVLGTFEHIADALGAYLTVRDHETIQVALKASHTRRRTK